MLLFHCLQISKSNVVDDMVASNSLLYKPGEKPDHCVVIKYVPFVGDSKRAMDEYTSEIMMGGRNTLVVHNTCEDSLLAAPLILDLIILTELCQRIQYRIGSESTLHTFHPVLSILSFLCKAPLVPPGTPVINALFRQRACIENILRACVGLAPVNHMLLEYKTETISDTLKQCGTHVHANVDAEVNGVHSGTINGHDGVVNGIHQTSHQKPSVNGLKNGFVSGKKGASHHVNGVSNGVNGIPAEFQDDSEIVEMQR